MFTSRLALLTDGAKFYNAKSFLAVGASVEYCSFRAQLQISLDLPCKPCNANLTIDTSALVVSTARIGIAIMAIDYLLHESPLGYAVFQVTHQPDIVGNRKKEFQSSVQVGDSALFPECR